VISKNKILKHLSLILNIPEYDTYHCEQAQEVNQRPNSNIIHPIPSTYTPQTNNQPTKQTKTHSSQTQVKSSTHQKVSKFIQHNFQPVHTHVFGTFFSSQDCPPPQASLSTKQARNNSEMRHIHTLNPYMHTNITTATATSDKNHQKST